MKITIETNPTELAAFLERLQDPGILGLSADKPGHGNNLPAEWAGTAGNGSLSTQLKSLRQQKQRTAKEVGDAIGVDKSTISQYETGRREPNIERLVKLSRFFGVTVDNLLGLSEETCFFST